MRLASSVSWVIALATLTTALPALSQPTAASRAAHVAVSPPAQAASGTELLALEREIGAAIVRGDVAFVDRVLAPDFVMVHGDGWTHGDKPALVDDRASFLKRVADDIYDAHDYDVQAAEMHGDVAITYGRYVGHIPGSPPGRRWFYVWYEKVYAKRDGRWVYLSHRTIDGAHYGEDRAAVSLPASAPSR